MEGQDKDKEKEEVKETQSTALVVEGQDKDKEQEEIKLETQLTALSVEGQDKGKEQEEIKSETQSTSPVAEGQDEGKELEEIKIETQLTALIVDDDKMVRNIHKGLLNKARVKNHAVKNGQEAIDIHCKGESFDLILIDKNMPVMNGIEATQKLRSMGVRSFIVGAATCSTDEEIGLFLEAGLDDYQAKPLTNETLNEVLDQLK